MTMWTKIIIILIWFVVVLIAKWWRDEAFYHKVTTWMNKNKFFKWWLKQKRPFDPWHFCDGVIVTGSFFTIVYLAFGELLWSAILTVIFFVTFYELFNLLFKGK
jgi:hypothetical protein